VDWPSYGREVKSATERILCSKGARILSFEAYESLGRNMEHPTNVPELMQFVQGTLQNMQEKFQNVEDSIVKRMNETGKKLDEIEKGLTDLMDHSGMGEPYEEDLESDKDFSDTDKGR